MKGKLNCTVWTEHIFHVLWEKREVDSLNEYEKRLSTGEMSQISGAREEYPRTSYTFKNLFRSNSNTKEAVNTLPKAKESAG